MDIRKCSLFLAYSKLLAPTPPTRLRRATSPQRGGLGFFDNLRSHTPMGYGIFAPAAHFRKIERIPSPSTVLRTASGEGRILPRAKNSPPDCFCPSLRTGAALSNPAFPSKKSHPEWGGIFWRSSRDSNPGDAFTPYEISSHASSTSLSTAP